MHIQDIEKVLKNDCSDWKRTEANSHIWKKVLTNRTYYCIITGPSEDQHTATFRSRRKGDKSFITNLPFVGTATNKEELDYIVTTQMG